jgi:hypothetical protein
MLLWLVAGFAALLALLAFGVARHLSRRLDKLSRSYWELQHHYRELSARLARLDPESQERSAEAPQAFVPLSAVKR